MPEPNISSFTGLLSDKDKDVADIASNVDALSVAKDLLRSLNRARWNKRDWALSGSREHPHDNYLMRTGLMDLSSGTTRAASADADNYNRIMFKRGGYGLSGLNKLPRNTAPWNQPLPYQADNLPNWNQTLPPIISNMPMLEDFYTEDWAKRKTIGI